MKFKLREALNGWFGPYQPDPPARPPAPIIADPAARGENVDFRRPGDDAHIIRVNQPRPKGFPKKIANYTPVAGVSHRVADVIAFIDGSNRELSLVRETRDDGLRPALAVYGAWLDARGGAHNALLGYVPRETNETIGDSPVAATLEAMFAPTPDKPTPGLRIDIWTTRPSKARATEPS